MSDWTVEPYNPDTDSPPDGHHVQGVDPPDLPPGDDELDAMRLDEP